MLCVEIEMTFIWPGVIQVWKGDELLYEGTSWLEARMATIPF